MTDRIKDTSVGSGTTAPFAAKLIFPNGDIKPVFPDDGPFFSYEKLVEFVGGYIEIIQPPTRTGAIIVCNEEGKLMGMPKNEIASRMWQEHAEPGSMRAADNIVGTILLCHRSQVE